MPLYEYKCEECGTKFEKLVSNFESTVSCTKCDSYNITKQFSVFAARVSEGGGMEGREMPAESCGSCSMPSQGMCDRNQ